MQFFPTCLVRMLREDVAEAALTLLVDAEYEPRMASGAICCGQPAYNSGYAKDARRVALFALKALSKDAKSRKEPCVVPSGSCAAMISRHWPELFAGSAHEQAAQAVAERTVELTVFLAKHKSHLGGPEESDAGDSSLASGQLEGAEDDSETGEGTSGKTSNGGRASGMPDGEAVVVHDACHALRELQAADAVHSLLRDAGYQVVTAPGADRCCGFGGLFSVKMPDVSVAMADEKLQLLAAAGCEKVASCDLSCLIHLEGRAQRIGLPLQFEHAASLLAKTRTTA